ncbi:MAG: 5-formyltetrahydrofolate cyclo-ligase [Candidatus Anammoxibacter sp.]
MNEIRNKKKKIRQEVLIKRKNLSKLEIKDRSEKICRQLVNLNEFKLCKSILMYVAMPDEVQTNDLFLIGLEQNKLLAAPIVQKADELLLLSILSEKQIKALLFKTSGNEYWNTSKFGVLEPRQDTVNPILIPEIELIIVPGLAFNRDGMRIGFGGGHYDRLLAKSNKSTLAVAVAFDFQIYNSIPHCDHDQKVDMIITDHGVIRPKHNRNENKQNR